MMKKALNIGLVAMSLMALIPSAANAERFRWNDGVWRSNSVYVPMHRDRRYKPYFKRGHWYSYNPRTNNWVRYRRMQSVNGGYWFY